MFRYCDNLLLLHFKDFQKEAVLKRELIAKMLELSRNQSAADPSLRRLTAQWEIMIKLEADRWNSLQHALRLVSTILQEFYINSLDLYLALWYFD